MHVHASTRTILHVVERAAINFATAHAGTARPDPRREIMEYDVLNGPRWRGEQGLTENDSKTAASDRP